MTTFAGARAELVTALASVGRGATSAVGRIDPPCIFLAGDGAEPDRLGYRSTWRMVLVGGKWDATAAADELDTLKLAAVNALAALAGWRMEALGRDGVRTFGDNQYLTAELRGVRIVDI